MNEAIKLAIEKGGYVMPYGSHIELDTVSTNIILDPLFWQALGKALGWSPGTIWRRIEMSDVKLMQVEAEGWLVKALTYYELLLTGRDTEKFWEELLIPQRKENL